VKRKSKRQSEEFKDIELNIMPFIDIFSLLNTFLLFSAVFLSIGVIEVQVPFLSNAAPETKQVDVRERKINIDVQRDKIILTESWTTPPIAEKILNYTNDTQGIAEMHAELIRLRQETPKVDKATVFSDDEVTFEQLSKVLDAVKLRWEKDPILPDASNDPLVNAANSGFLLPKIVMGSVIL
jgi:biopolymer transport protein TolR